MKKLAWLLSLIICLATFVICPSAQADEAPRVSLAQTWTMTSPYLKFQGGHLNYGYENNPNWNLHSGTGERKFISHIQFPESYVIPPSVVVYLTGINADNNSDSRIKVIAKNIDAKGFDIEYTTWADSQIDAIWSSWTAFGE